jgi:hypothetical protein
VKVNRKSTPKMVVRPYFTSEYQQLERRERNIERAKFTIALMVAWIIAVMIWEVTVTKWKCSICYRQMATETKSHRSACPDLHASSTGRW